MNREKNKYSEDFYRAKELKWIIYERIKIDHIWNPEVIKSLEILN